MEVRVSAIVLGYGKEEFLETCLEATARELRADDELILVDNGIDNAAARRPRWPSQVKLIGDGTNTGFAGGCNYAVSEAVGDVFVLVNSDAIVRPGSFPHLVAAASEPEVGLAGGCLRLAKEPDKVNSVGNPLQFLGVTWAGACGEVADDHRARTDVAIATGGFFAVRREVWDELGGFDPLYFAYHEDADLSLRCWMSGLRVVYEPEAVADHHYEFTRNPRKMYLVERNRLITVLTDYPGPLLLAVLPLLFLLEPAFLIIAASQGWADQKLRSWWWLVCHAGMLRSRRRVVQAKVTVNSATVANLMCSRIKPPMVKPPPGMAALNLVLAIYWAVALRSLRRMAPTSHTD